MATRPVGAAATVAEQRWRQQVRRFAAEVVSDLARVRASTVGGPSGAVVGTRLDPRVLVAGPRRRSFLATVTALAHCRRRLAVAVPPPPSVRLQPVRDALANACSALSSAAPSLADGSLALARRQAADAVRLVVDALAILARVL